MRSRIFTRALINCPHVAARRISLRTVALLMGSGVGSDPRVFSSTLDSFSGDPIIIEEGCNVSLDCFRRILVESLKEGSLEVKTSARAGPE